MRKLIVSMNLTLDGFMAGADRELDWHFHSWSSRMARVLGEQLSRADTILLGRITYTAMAGFWPAQVHNLSLSREDIAFAGMMNSHRKIVFSNTLQKPLWNNTIIVRGDIPREVKKLKEMRGTNMIIYGSGSLVSSLMRSNLVDEYTLWVHPVFLGKGKPMYDELNRAIPMDLLGTESFGSGVVKMDFQPVQSRSGQTDIKTPDLDRKISDISTGLYN